MNAPYSKKGPYPRAGDVAKAAKLHVDSPQTRSPSYKLAYQDEKFLLRDELSLFNILTCCYVYVFMGLF